MRHPAVRWYHHPHPTAHPVLPTVQMNVDRHEKSSLLVGLAGEYKRDLWGSDKEDKKLVLLATE